MVTLKQQFSIEFCALKNAIHRCHSSKNKQFKDYGGRGIFVCDEWRGKDGFRNFLDHIGPKQNSTWSLDRIDNNKGYEPGNVRWVDRSTQQLNRRVVKKSKKTKEAKPRKAHSPRSDSMIITIGNESLTIKAWGQKMGLNPRTIYSRLVRGKSDYALITPARGYKL